MAKTVKEEKASAMGIFDEWTDYSRNLETQITTALEENHAECEKLYTSWVDFSKSLETNINPAVSDEKSKEVFNVWKNYNNKIDARLSKMVSENSANSEKMMNLYSEYSRNTLDNVLKSSKSDKDMVSDLHASWFDFANHMNTDITKLMARSHEENQKLLDMWSDFIGKMNSQMGPLTDQNGIGFNKLFTEWSANSEKFGETMTNFFKNDKTHYKDFYATWISETKKMNDWYANLAVNFGTDVEKLYQIYFERTMALQKNLMMFQFPNAYSLNNEISELRKKVLELEKKLNEQ